jgi:hypothetical protein
MHEEEDIDAHFSFGAINETKYNNTVSSPTVSKYQCKPLRNVIMESSSWDSFDMKYNYDNKMTQSLINSLDVISSSTTSESNTCQENSNEVDSIMSTNGLNITNHSIIVESLSTAENVEEPSYQENIEYLKQKLLISTRENGIMTQKLSEYKQRVAMLQTRMSQLLQSRSLVEQRVANVINENMKLRNENMRNSQDSDVEDVNDKCVFNVPSFQRSQLSETTRQLSSDSNF